MKYRLLEFLICPLCHGDLELRDPREAKGEIVAGRLRCVTCGTRFPIINGVPRFLPGKVDEDRERTARAFGYEWKQFSELKPEYERQFLDWISPVNAEFFADRVVLDAGCGKGRHVSCAAKFGAREVIGLDLSEAVEAAYQNTRHLPAAHIIQADLHHLPLRPESFDYVYSVGVLHHLPDPRRGFEGLLPMIRPGGRISIWVYGKENNEWIARFITPLRNVVTTHLPLWLLNLLSGIATALILWPALKLVYWPINRFAKPLARFLFYNDYLAYISRFGFQEMHSIVFDHLVAPVAHYLSQEEVASWFARAEFSEVTIGWHNRNSWRATASYCGLQIADCGLRTAVSEIRSPGSSFGRNPKSEI